MYSTEFVPDPEQLKGSAPSYGTALKNVAVSATNLLHRELDLVRAEFKTSATRVREHVIEVAVFGALLVLSVFPFLAFAVIALGELFDGRYWLSSLLVAVVCAGVGGYLSFRAYRKIKNDDIDFSRSRRTLNTTANTVRRHVDKLKDAALNNTQRGGKYGPVHNSI